MRTSQPAPCPRATSRALDVLPWYEPASGFWELPNKVPCLCWVLPGFPSAPGRRQERSCNGVRCIQVVIWAGKSGFAEFARNVQKRSPVSDQRMGLSSQLSKWGLMMLLLLPRLETTQTMRSQPGLCNAKLSPKRSCVAAPS